MKKLNLFKAVCVAVALSASSYAVAETITQDGYTFEVLPEEELAVKLVGIDQSISGDVIIPGEVNYEGKTYTLTAIENFKGGGNITSVVVPNSVKIMGENCFIFMMDLTSVTLSENLVEMGTYMFQGCYSLESVVIPNSVQSIGNYVLSLCPALKSVTIG